MMPIRKHGFLLSLLIFTVASLDVTLMPGATAADAPAIARIFPAGGQRGQSTTVKLNGKPGSLPLQFWSSSSDLEGNIAEDGRTATIDAADSTTPGVYWLRFYNSYGATELLPFIVGTITEITETEPNDRLDDVLPDRHGSVVVNGVLSKTEDVDCAAIRLAAGQTLVAAVQAQTVLGSPMDAVLQILSPEGAVLDQNDDDHGFDPLLAFMAPAEGTYWIRIFAFPATPNSTIHFAGGSDFVYRLTLATDEFIDHTMPAAVTADTACDVRLHGWNISGEAEAVGIRLPLDDDPVTIATSAAGSATVDVVDYPAFCEDNFPASPAAPFCVSGCIAASGEHDVFRFLGKQSQQIEVSVVARSKYSLLDPVLTVKRSDDKVLQEADDISDDNHDARLAIKIPDDGEYMIEVTDRFGSGGWRYFYLVTCMEPQPHFLVSVEASQYALSNENPLEIPVSIDRQNGFSETIRVGADALPDGVSCELVESLKEGDTSKSVTLKMSTTLATGYFGTFRIVATVDSVADNSVETKAHNRSAVVTSANGTVTTDSLWLTVLPVPETADEE